MEDQGPTPLNRLISYEKIPKIIVHVYRIWRPRFSGKTDKYASLHSILVDEKSYLLIHHMFDNFFFLLCPCLIIKQQVIKASSDEMDYEIIYRVVPHDTHFPLIPHHRFFLQDYNRLYPRPNKTDTLTDVIGHVVAVQRLEPIKVNQRSDHKCDVVIQNIRQSYTFLKKKNLTHNFTSLSYDSLLEARITVFTSLKVKIFADNSAYVLHGRFSGLPHPVTTLPPSNQARETEVIIEELGYLDPDLYKDHTFLCKTSIKQYNTTYEWWYAACPTCAKQMYKVFLVIEDDTNEINALIIGKSGEKVFGMPCKDLVFNQRSTDHKQLSSEFLRLIGQRKNFHLRFRNQRNLLNSNDFLVYNISEDTMIQPITPQSIIKEIVFHHLLHQLKKLEKRTREKEIQPGEPFLQKLKTGSQHFFLILIFNLTEIYLPNLFNMFGMILIEESRFSPDPLCENFEDLNFNRMTQRQEK
ncbi:hypothetical protein DVH24_010777 [Malus domestica]|uniref:Replication factor A C-terminal domain-containing protein n=1 Tax=Malus domestica TaxID=3750 RepID=A0A498JY94_MALDO|nr:hypothetical protein DVH24_010777 [Malus domestica]